MELSIIAGNDFTAPFSQQLKERLGLRDRSHVTQIADWVREHGSLENHPGACELMVRVIIIIHVAVFCPGFQKGRVPSEKGTLER